MPSSMPPSATPPGTPPATALAQPLTLPSGLTLPNRIVKAPMTENLADAANQPTSAHERVYRRWAEGGAGLLITGNLMIDRRYLERSRNIVADRHLDISRLARVREAAAGVPMVAQLNHPGRQTNRFIALRPVGPSEADAVPMFGLFGKPRALTEGDIEEIIRRFGESAARCELAGLDGVQVHAAHGYLLAQFLSPHVNRRTDGWGGGVAGRARALLAAVRSVREATSPGFTVGVKLNSSDFRHGGFTEDDAVEVVRLLVAEGIDFLEISGGTYESPALLGLGIDAGTQATAKEAYFAGFAQKARAVAGATPLMLVGGIRTRAAMEALLADGVDLIGLGRPLALEPELPKALLAGADGITLPAYSLPSALGLAGESEWYETQIGRIGRGEDVKRSLHPVTAATRFIVGEAGRGLREGRRRRRLTATS